LIRERIASPILGTVQGARERIRAAAPGYCDPP